MWASSNIVFPVLKLDSTNKLYFCRQCTYIIFILQYHACKMKNIVNTQKGKNIGYIGWISYRVSTAQCMFHRCVLRFTLYKTQSTRRLHTFTRRIPQRFMLCVQLYEGSKCTDYSINHKYMRIIIQKTCKYCCVLYWTLKTLIINIHHDVIATLKSTIQK